MVKENSDSLEKFYEEEYKAMNPIDKIPIEDKLTAAHVEEMRGLEPWEISEIVNTALQEGRPACLEEHMDALFDTLYEAILEALERARG